MRQQRKGSRATLKRKCDKLFSEKVRAVGMCELKGLDKVECSDTLQTMHIIGRSNFNLRWDSMNALCGCSGHHMYYTSHPTEFAMLVAEVWPEQWAYLLEHKNEIWDKDLDRVYEELVDWKPL